MIVSDRRASHGNQIAADGFGTGKIQRRSLNCGDLSGWDQRAVHRGVMRGEDSENVLAYARNAGVLKLK